MNPRTLPGPVGAISGAVDLPTSKSLTNRALIAAAVADGGRIVNPLECDDTRVLAGALRQAGWPVEWRDDIVLGGRVRAPGRRVLDLADSGTGARLILGLLAASPGRFLVQGSARLAERPMAPLLAALDKLGAKMKATDGALPVEVDGTVLEGGCLEVRPEVSSQFVSALLLAAPLMARDLRLQVAGPLPSGPYLDLTADVLRRFGSNLSSSDDRRSWHVPAMRLRPSIFEVESDWSAAAFVLAAVAVAGGEIDIGPLDQESRQGDRSVLEILIGAGLGVRWEGGRLRARGPVSAPFEADLIDAPDLFPALATVAACAPPGSRLSGLEHLVHKESDRLTAMVDNLRSLGARLEIDGPRLEFRRGIDIERRVRRKVTAVGDHRIAMAMAVAGLAAGPLEIDDDSCVSKSFPGFWTVWERLTGAEAG